MKLATIPVPAKRLVCCFCRKPLAEPIACTSAGIVVLVCPAHAEEGDRMVRVVQMLARKAGQLEQTEAELTLNQ